jgi:hypothetical protein
MRVNALIAFLCIGGSLAFAQGPRGHMGGPGFGPMAGLEHGKVVTGAPFTATLQETFTQKLPDGNTITRTTTSQFARDSQGRTWLQTTANHFGPWTSTTGASKTLTFITDPVAGSAYTLDQTKMTAMQHKLPPARVNSESTGGPRHRPENDAEEGAVRTPLGTQVSSPLPSALEGTQITRTIAANRIGNAQAIVTTTSRWYSPDLKMVVQQTSTDPRNGTRTFQVTNIQLVEPSAALFQVPSGYSVTTGPGRPAMKLAQ